MYKYIIAIALLTATVGCSRVAEPAQQEEKKACCEKDDAAEAEQVNKTVSSESLFLLDDEFRTQNDEPFTMSMLEGKPTVVGMIFTQCAYACPRLTTDIMNIAENIDAEDVNFLLVSFDVKRDYPAQLKEYASKMGIPDSWTLLHGDDDAVRTMSILLNVQYEELEDGGFNHSNLVSVLDKDGKLVYQVEGLNANHEGTITTLNSILNN